MRSGKLSTTELENYVLSRLKKLRGEVILSAAEGEDCAAIKGSGTIVVSSDPITAAMSPESLGRLAVSVNTNDIAANGGKPVAMMLTVIVPPDYPPEDIGRIVTAASSAAAEVGVEIAGGHTEFSDCVTRAVVSATAVGFCKRLLSKSAIRKGNALGVTKRLGMEGVTVLLEALNRTDSPLYERYSKSLSVLPESRVLSALPGVTMMHDITEGGVLGAVAEVVTPRGLGADIFADKLPIDAEAADFCKETGVDITRLLSSGSMLFAADDMTAALSALAKAGIDACEIGVVTDGRVRFIGGGDDDVKVKRDALYDYFDGGVK